MLTKVSPLAITPKSFKDDRQNCFGSFGGKSGLRRAVQRVTPFHRKVRTSGTERMSAAMSQDAGNGRHLRS